MAIFDRELHQSPKCVIKNKVQLINVIIEHLFAIGKKKDF